MGVNKMDWTGYLTAAIIIGFCGAGIYAIFQVGRYFKKKANSIK